MRVQAKSTNRLFWRHSSFGNSVSGFTFRDYCTAESLGTLRQCITRLPQRSLLKLSGQGTIKWLQGLTTNDVTPLGGGETSAVFSAILSPQGRVLAEVVLSTSGNAENGHPSIVLECDSRVYEVLKKHLTRFKLREKVEIEEISSRFDVWSMLHADSGILDERASTLRTKGYLTFKDPRSPLMGVRAILPKGADPQQGSELVEVEPTVYNLYRILNGVCEGADEVPSNVALPLECNIDLLNGVSFTKGCYVGQELTSRVHHTGVVRKRLLPIIAFADEEASHGEDITRKITAHYAAASRQTLFPPALFCKSFRTQRLESGQTLLQPALAKSGKEEKKSGKILSGGVYNVGMGLVRMENVDSVFEVSSGEGQKLCYARALIPTVFRPHVLETNGGSAPSDV